MGLTSLDLEVESSPIFIRTRCYLSLQWSGFLSGLLQGLSGYHLLSLRILLVSWQFLIGMVRDLDVDFDGLYAAVFVVACGDVIFLDRSS